LNAPRGALPTGVRVAATIYASSQWLAGLERVGDALLRPGILEQRHELAALEVEEPLLVHEAPRLDLAAAQHACDAQSYLEVMRGDESAVAHVDQHHFERGDTGLARDRDPGER
jgi:hypothetical protein